MIPNRISLQEPDELDRYLDSVEHLPPTPGLMTKLIQLFKEPDRDVDEIVELMRRDPSITAELLRRCNSSYFGNGEPVTDVGEAVFRLGFYEVYRLTIALFGQKTLAIKTNAADADIEALWHHSIVTAIIAETLACELDESEGCAFSAGLLHDVGKIILASQEAQTYAALLKQYANHGTALHDAEKLRFGFTHVGIGARLLNRWELPEDVVVPVFCHHQTDWAGPFGRSAAIVSLANIIAHRLDDGASESPDDSATASAAMKFLFLNDFDLPALEQMGSKDLERLGPLFAIGQIG